MDECASDDIVIGGVTSGIGHPYRRLDGWQVRLAYVWFAGLCVHIHQIYLSLNRLVLFKIDNGEKRTVLQLSINIDHFEGVHPVLLLDLSDRRRWWRRRALHYIIFIIIHKSFYLGQTLQMTTAFCKVFKVITTSGGVSEAWARSLFIVLLTLALLFTLWANKLL